MEDDDFADFVDDADVGSEPGDVDDDDLSASFEQAPIKRSASYTVLTQDEIMSASQQMMKEVTEVLSLPSQAAACALLRHYGWNKERLIEQYMEDPEKVCANVGMASLKLEASNEGTEITVCPVCEEQFPKKETFALACEHRYCLDCWRTYLEVRVKEGSECILTHCMQPKCRELVHDAAFRKLCSAATWDRYSMFLRRSFVDDSLSAKWCPSPGCSNCVRCDRRNRTEPVCCRCGFVYCFNCSDAEIGEHDPATCEQVQKWKAKAQDESENVRWMTANTKSCPKCRSPIEKNGGCMHMTCSKAGGGCGHEFCWMCRGPWSEHGSATGGYYSCNKYDANKEAQLEDTKAENTRTELEYYMFYYHRYDSHRNALKIAKEQMLKADLKSEELQTVFEVRSQDCKFLAEAVGQLLQNRRMLQWSYVYGFYLPKGCQEKNLFEYLQEDLEKHTNYLSELYERPVAAIVGYQAFVEWKENVTNVTRVCHKFLENFRAGVIAGLTTSRQ